MHLHPLDQPARIARGSVDIIEVPHAGIGSGAVARHDVVLGGQAVERVITEGRLDHPAVTTDRQAGRRLHRPADEVVAVCCDLVCRRITKPRELAPGVVIALRLEHVVLFDLGHPAVIVVGVGIDRTVAVGYGSKISFFEIILMSLYTRVNKLKAII